jgi:peptidoglycan/LPS O-acetylase OafA/YrhL
MARWGNSIGDLGPRNHGVVSVLRGVCCKFVRAVGVNGVPIFFGISGLLICKLLLEEAASSGTISLSAFYLRRCFRILPPLFAFLLVAYFVGCIVRPWELVSSVFFFRNYLPDSLASGFSSHLWSL